MGLATVALLTSCSAPVATPSATASDVEWIQYHIDTNHFEEAVDLAVTTYDIDTANVNGDIVYDGSGRHVPELWNALTTPDREVYIGLGTFFNPDIETSPGLLGATIGHEVEHTNQIVGNRHHSQVSDPLLSDIQSNVNEYEAFKWVFDHASKFGLTEEEIKYVQDRMKHYYDLLPDEYKKRVNDGNYEIP